MKSHFIVTLTFILFGIGCTSDLAESVTHRRNFAKNVFEEEFASIEIGCDTTSQAIILKNTNWLKIDKSHALPDDSESYLFEKNKKLSLIERDYAHDLILEKIDNGAFMFRYTGTQDLIDTVKAVTLENFNKDVLSEIDSMRIFNIENQKYYQLSPDSKDYNEEDVKTLYRNNKTIDKGRVVCKCDYYKVL